MKSAEEWQHEIPRRFNMGEMQIEESSLGLYIRAIQADALREAAELCQDVGDMHRGSGAWCYEARDALKAAAAALEKEKK